MGLKQGHNINVGMRSCAIAMAIAHAIVSSKCAKNSKIKNVKKKKLKFYFYFYFYLRVNF